MGPYFFLQTIYFASLTAKPVRSMSGDYVGLKLCFLGTSTYIVIMTFFLVVNRSGLGTSSTSNQRSSKALGRLHGPWCKQPHNDP